MPLTVGELERLRLVLSTFQDGSGWEKIEGSTLVGYRQFERALAEVLNGVARESKALFDVLATRATAAGNRLVGYSCKAKRELSPSGQREIYIEVGNAGSAYRKHLEKEGLRDPFDYAARPDVAGSQVLKYIEALHLADCAMTGASEQDSCYFVLLYDASGTHFECFEIPLDVMANAPIAWTAPGQHVRGTLNGKKAVEYYWGVGQVKFYVPVTQATWRSGVFQMEPLAGSAKSLGARAEEAFPEAWRRASRLP